jgi:hypothetical protein
MLTLYAIAAGGPGDICIDGPSPLGYRAYFSSEAKRGGSYQSTIPRALAAWR